MKNIVMQEVNGVGWIASKPKRSFIGPALAMVIFGSMFGYAVVNSFKW